MVGHKAKPFKLKPSEGVMTRDDLALWEYTLIATCRQTPDWQKFLPGGNNQNWTATDDDPNNGLEHANAETQAKLRSDFANFLTCVATHCPTGFLDTVIRESTSFKGIVQSIRSTYGLDSKGEKFLAIGDIKLEFSPSFTYEQGYMQIKDFCMQSLMTRGSRFKGRELRENEILTPLAENFIMKEFLHKVHPKLPDHIKNTKGHLFTQDRPTLACNKTVLLDMMDSMLAEIECADTMNANSLAINLVGQPGSARGNRANFNRQPNRGTWIRGQSSRYNRGIRAPFPVRPQVYPRREECSYCVEARMYDSSKGHSYANCPFRLGLATPYQQQSRSTSGHPNNMKVLLVQDQSYDPYQNQMYEETNSYDHSFNNFGENHADQFRQYEANLDYHNYEDANGSYQPDIPL